MSNSDKTLVTAQPTRRTTAAASARPRAPSRNEAGDYSDSAGEIFPQDSVSNAPHRRTISTSHKSARSKRDVYEKRAETTRTTIIETGQTRTRSPARTLVDHGVNGHTTLPGERNIIAEKRIASHEGSRQKKAKEALRKFG